jgi:8-oxo-dGTP pyrophosphatase MutT (NUDIX family)
MSGKADALQYAALPWRRNGDIEILLITSRETRRWVIPKGWPIQGLSPEHSAAREAFEEAGIEGEVAQDAIGRYHYLKRRKDGTTSVVNVAVFPLEVTRQHEQWPEREERETKWFPAAQAGKLVLESSLAELIRRFCAGV